jgi:uncharacterized protein (TIGR03067 family)
MRLRLLLFGVGLVCVAGAVAQDAKKEQELLKGTWSVVAAEKGGEKAPAEAIKDMKLHFAEGKITIKHPGGERESTFKLDPAKKPKVIDIMPGDGPNKGKTLPGIYELKGDDLRIALGETDAARPTEFASKAGEGQMLMILKRDK